MSSKRPTREEFIKNLFKTYSLVGVLSEKNDCKALRIRHKELQKDIVLHSFPKQVKAYEFLCDIHAKNLPEIYDVIDVSDGQIVLEEFIDGVSVAQVMESGRYRYFGAKKVIIGVCNALKILHNKNIVHRDVKPQNVMIDKNGRVVLIDFNASRKVEIGGKDTEIMGSVGYASPEQLGVLQSDRRTDIYAVGIMLNVMLTGKHPSEQLAKGKAKRIVKKCTSVNPNDRFQSAEKLARSL